jgi:RNA polymerase sigma-70 factor (ECF subfamily)
MSPPDGLIADPAPAPAPAPATSEPPLADIYLQHRAWLLRTLSLRYGVEAGEELAQDTYLRVHGYAPSGPVRQPRNLLMRIALNLASNLARKRGREVLAEPADPAFILPEPSTQEQGVLFAQMMLALPPKLRDVFVLSHVRGLTYREIARLRGISEKAVEKRMSQAIARCTDLLAP